MYVKRADFTPAMFERGKVFLAPFLIGNASCKR
jgi:hypothetical protein